MNPKVWGPIVWYNFHILSYSYRDEECERYKIMFKSMPYMIPCLKCKEHFKAALIRSSPNDNITDRDNMVKWLCDIHNIVNKVLRKRVITLKQADKVYHNATGNLKINHIKMSKFIKLVRTYVSGGVSSIVFYHGSNILVNYCHTCPCSKCRVKLIKMLEDYDLKNRGLVQFTKNMVQVINKCGKNK